jgi:hypothetical protein
MDFTKSELLKGIERYINGARKRAIKWVTLPLEDFLLAMQRDQRGGIEQVAGVVEEICVACDCHGAIENKGHQQQVVFGI